MDSDMAMPHVLQMAQKAVSVLAQEVGRYTEAPLLEAKDMV